MVFDLGVRWVRLDRLNALLSARLRLVTLAGGDDLAVGGLEVVFSAPAGGVLRIATFRTRVFNVAVNTLRGLDDDGNPTTDWPRPTLHDLRHTAASLAISAGANVKAVQTMLGHKSAALTLDTYTDLFPDDLEGVADALDAAVRTLRETTADALRTDAESAP